MENAKADDHLFRLSSEEGGADRRITHVEPSPYTAGPWNPSHQHGGAVAALLVRCLSRMPSAAPMRLTRLSLEMFRGVPVAPLRVETRIVRDGRRIQSSEATLFDGDQPVARATSLRIRETEDLPELESLASIDPAIGKPPETVPPFVMRAGIEVPGFVRACELVTTPAERCGEPGRMWTRLLCQIIEGELPSPIERLAGVVDFASGSGNVMDYTAYTSINPDLSVHFLRAPTSDWLAIQGLTHRASDGIGQSEATIFDETGAVARACASLLLDRR